MPNYQYECAGCGHEFLEFQTMSEDRLTKCPECKKNKLERLISGGSAVVFKGSGFYETDYKKKTNAEPAKSTSDSKTNSDSSTKSDSATKSETVTKSESSKSTDSKE